MNTYGTETNQIVPYSFPSCKPACETSSGSQILGKLYTFADGRCFQAKTNCAGCLELIQSGQDAAADFPTHFNSCSTNVDTRY